MKKSKMPPLKFGKGETLLPATLVCTRKPIGNSNDGAYEVTIPLIYMTEALKTPAKFYKFKFIGLRYMEGI